MNARVLAFATICALSLALVSQAQSAEVAASMDGSMQSMPGMHEMPKAHAVSGMSIYNLNGRWMTQDGVAEPLSSLHGKLVVAAMIFTHCRDVCPLIAERMQEVERKLPARKRESVRFVLFSLDWTRDTPEQLRRFASQHGLDRNNWTLFHGNESAVRALAAALGVSFYRAANGDYQHSIAIFVLDREGVMRSEQGDLEKPQLHLLAALTSLLAHH